MALMLGAEASLPLVRLFQKRCASIINKSPVEKSSHILFHAP